MRDTLDHKLRIGGCLSKVHWYPEPPELTLVLTLPKLCPVLPCIIELVLVPGHPFINWDDVFVRPQDLSTAALVR